MTLIEASSDLENLRKLAADFRVCCLFEEASSLTELIISIPSYSPRNSLVTNLSDTEQAAADLFNLRQYSRVESMLNPVESEVSFCLVVYSLLLAAQQDMLLLGRKKMRDLKLKELVSKIPLSNLGSIACYLVGNVHTHLGDAATAAACFAAAVKSNPLNLPALMKVENAEGTWIGKYARALKGDDALEAMSDFPNVRKIQLAAAKAGERPEVSLKNIFKNGLSGNLEGASLYSHFLFVEKNSAELDKLAKECFEIDRLSPETLKVVADNFTLHGQREKAVLALRKAAQISPGDASISILLGHAFLELRNIPAAIQAYSQAVEFAPKEPAACAALAMAYDLLGQKSFADYYQKKASVLGN